MKLKPGLRAFYDILSGNRSDLIYSWQWWH